MGRLSLGLAVAALMVCWPAAALAQRPTPRAPFDRCDITFDPVALSRPFNPMSPHPYIYAFTTVARRSVTAETRGMIYTPCCSGMPTTGSPPNCL